MFFLSLVKFKYSLTMAYKNSIMPLIANNHYLTICMNSYPHNHIYTVWQFSDLHFHLLGVVTCSYMASVFPSSHQYMYLLTLNSDVSSWSRIIPNYFNCDKIMFFPDETLSLPKLTYYDRDLQLPWSLLKLRAFN